MPYKESGTHYADCEECDWIAEADDRRDAQDASARHTDTAPDLRRPDDRLVGGLLRRRSHRLARHWIGESPARPSPIGGGGGWKGHRALFHPLSCPLTYPDNVEDTMIQRLERAALAWPKIPGRPTDLQWRDHRRPSPDELDRLILG